MDIYQLNFKYHNKVTAIYIEQIFDTISLLLYVIFGIFVKYDTLESHNKTHTLLIR